MLGQVCNGLPHSDGTVAGFIAEVPDLIDLTRHRRQHAGVLVFDAQAQGFGAIHAVYFAIQISCEGLLTCFWLLALAKTVSATAFTLFLYYHLVLINKITRPLTNYAMSDIVYMNSYHIRQSKTPSK